MCRTQSLVGLCALLALTGCKGEVGSGPGQTATPSSGPGHCVPYEPFAGYKTCVMSAPQISKSYGVTSRRPSSDDALPTFVDHRTYMRGCVTVHNQGICGWCVANSVTGMLEAELCREKKPSERISEPHLWSLGVANQTVADTECAGGWFMDKAVEAAASTYLVPNLAWPYPTEDEWRATYDEDSAVWQSNVTQWVGSRRPSDADLLAAGQYRAEDTVNLAGNSVDVLKRALAEGNNISYGVPVFRGTGWGEHDQTDHGANAYGRIYHPEGASVDCNCKCDRDAQSNIVGDCKECADQPHCLEGWHAILFVGYDDSSRSFILLNSWSTEWADGGYGMISYDTVAAFGMGGAYARRTQVNPGNVSQCSGCSGCCQNGLCVSSPTDTACGSGGAPCVTCLASGGACVSGKCTACTPDCVGKCAGASDGCGGTCAASTCIGCCKGSQCITASSNAACGAGGAACVDCTLQGGKCDGTQCSSCTPSCAGKCPGASNGCGGTCAVTNCSGCCNGTLCVVSLTDDFCGSGGSPCVSCRLVGSNCKSGKCTTCSPDCSGKCAGASDGCGGTCSGNGCSGCCSGTQCVTLSTPYACGHDGGACVDCSVLGGTCSGGKCTTCTPSCGGRCAGASDDCGGTCPTNNCSGCCDSARKCQSGSTNQTCGASGGACLFCATDYNCVSGSCAFDLTARFQVKAVSASLLNTSSACQSSATILSGCIATGNTCWDPCTPQLGISCNCSESGPDALIVVSVGPIASSTAKGTSSQILNTFDPQWNATLFTTTAGDIIQKGLYVQVWDQDQMMPLQDDDLVGQLESHPTTADFAHNWAGRTVTLNTSSGNVVRSCTLQFTRVP